MPIREQSERHTFFATCAPGVEALLFAEVRALRLARAEQQVGGVYFEGEMADAWRANLCLRTAVRVRRWLARFPAEDADALYRGVAAVDWRAHIEPEGSLVVGARSKDSALTHTQFVEQRVKDAIVDQLQERFGARPSVDKEDPDLRVHLHLFRDRATLSIDTSGDSLHKRGWRLHQGIAPLSETLAAALILASGWDRRAPLLDPFCGSGTLVIEAALFAGNVAPGLFRPRFGFERWPGHDAVGYAKLKRELAAQRSFSRHVRILGSDVDPERVDEARANAAAAGVAEHVELSVADARDFAPRAGWNGLVLTNPPYGERLGEADELVELYRAFGALLRERCGGYRLALLSGSPELAKALGLKGAERLRLKNGALSVHLLCYELNRRD